MTMIHGLVAILIVCLVVAAALVVRRMAHQSYPIDGRIVDTVRLARIARIATCVWLAADIGVILASIGTIAVLGGFGGPMGSTRALSSADTFTTVTGVAYLITFLVAGGTILRWIHLTIRNAHALDPSMTITPGWAVGWFFVPIAGLWKPFDGMRQAWQASANPQAPDSVPIPAVLRWWWGAWVVTSIIGNIIFSLTNKADTVDALIVANAVTVATLPVDIVLAIALTTILRRLSQMQRDAAGGAAQARPETVEDAVF